MTTEVADSSLLNTSLSEISKVDAGDHLINTFSNGNQEPGNDQHNNDPSRNNDTLNDGQSDFDASLNENIANDARIETTAGVTNENVTQSSENNTQPMPSQRDDTTNPDETQLDPATSATTDSHPNQEQAVNENQENGGEQVLEPEQFRKCFIGGLSYKTENDTLRDHFSKFGELVDYVVMKDNNTNKPKGFGFVTYAKSSMVDEMMKHRPHIIDGRQVEPKRATPREDSGRREVHATVKKLFIGGLRDEIGEEELRNYFALYGSINEIAVMRDKETGKSRGFGFITYDDYDPIDKIILEKHHQINGVNLHCQKALPKDSSGGGQRNAGGGGGYRNNMNFGGDGGFYQSQDFQGYNRGFEGQAGAFGFNSPMMAGGAGDVYGSYNSNKMPMRGGFGGGGPMRTFGQGNRGSGGGGGGGGGRPAPYGGFSRGGGRGGRGGPRANNENQF